MALKYRSTEVFLRPDVRHKSKVIAKFINCLMYGGKKSTAESCFYKALDILEEKVPGVDPLKAFETCIENVRPTLEVRSKRVGGATYQVPVEVPQEPRAGARHPVDPPGGPRPEGKADAHQTGGGTRGRVQQDGRGVHPAGERSQDGGSQQGVRALCLVNRPRESGGRDA